MYALFLSVAICVLYAVLKTFYAAFFNYNVNFPLKETLTHFGILVLVMLSGYFVSLHVSNGFLGNRILHAWCGAFVAFTACFFATRRSPLSRFQFIALSILVVTSLGVANELLELILQSTTTHVFAGTMTDTWYDLASNTVGIIVGIACYAPLYERR